MRMNFTISYPAWLPVFFALMLSGFHSAKAEVEYQVVQPSNPVIQTYREYQFSVSSREPIDIAPLPKHHKVFWLSRIASREESMIHFDAHVVTINFMATSPGTITFPAIPMKVGKESFVIKLDDLIANPNPLPSNSCDMQFHWNGFEEPPKTLYIGQSVDLNIRQLVAVDSIANRQENPHRHIEGVDWHVFTPTPGRRARPEDYLRPFRSWFQDQFSRHIRRYRIEPKLVGEQEYRAYNYQARFTVGSTERLKGHCYFSISSSDKRLSRVSLAQLDLPVKSVPPLPHENAVDTGLIGDWELRGLLSPRAIQPKEPLYLSIFAEGYGNPTLLRSLDFSRKGFSSIQLKSEHENRNQRLATRQSIKISQELLATGEAATFPKVTLATFDPQQEDWKLHSISPEIQLIGVSNNLSEFPLMQPSLEKGKSFQRPILLNLPAISFPLIALAPLLPFLAGFVRKRLDERDPEAEEERNHNQELIERLQSDEAAPTLIDTEVLPALRNSLNLPTGATAREVAKALPAEHEEMAELLITHSDSAFGAKKTEIDLKVIVTHLSKILLILAFTVLPLRASLLSEANQAFTEKRYQAAAESYQKIIVDHPGHPELHLNLAKARLAADQPAQARAACHTALLLDPLNPEGRTLMDQILTRLGQASLPGTQFLALRPDQFLKISLACWIFTFAFIATRRLKSDFPRWPAFLCLVAVFIFAAIAFWRNSHAYAAEQYMVLADELPREPKVGMPNWDFPALRSGQIVEVDSSNETHAFIVTPDTSFWLPLDQLQQVW